MKYNFDEPVDRSQNRSAKYDERVKNFGTDDVIPLWIADMDFKTAQPIIDACKKKAEEGIWGYTSRPDSYFKAYADWQERRNGWKFDPSLCRVPYKKNYKEKISLGKHFHNVLCLSEAKGMDIKMKYNFDEPVDRSQNRSAKYDERVKNFGTDDVIPLWIADMDFKTAQPIIDACKKKAEEGIWGYTSRPDSYFKAYADWQERRNGWKFDPSLCSWSLGVVPALAGIIKLFTQKGEKVLIQPPVYPEFFDITENTGRILVQNNFLERDGVWEVDFEDFERQAKDPEVKLFILYHQAVYPKGRKGPDPAAGVPGIFRYHRKYRKDPGAE